MYKRDYIEKMEVLLELELERRIEQIRFVAKIEYYQMVIDMPGQKDHRQETEA